MSRRNRKKKAIAPKQEPVVQTGDLSAHIMNAGNYSYELNNDGTILVDAINRELMKDLEQSESERLHRVLTHADWPADEPESTRSNDSTGLFQQRPANWSHDPNAGMKPPPRTAKVRTMVHHTQEGMPTLVANPSAVVASTGGGVIGSTPVMNAADQISNRLMALEKRVTDLEKENKELRRKLEAKPLPKKKRGLTYPAVEQPDVNPPNECGMCGKALEPRPNAHYGMDERTEVPVCMDCVGGEDWTFWDRTALIRRCRVCPDQPALKPKMYEHARTIQHQIALAAMEGGTR